LDLDRLLQRARSGDKSAESEILKYLSARFRLLAERRVESREVAEDIAQTACVAVLENYRTAVFDKGFAPWAHGILRMKVGNYYQKRKTLRSTVTSGVEIEGGSGSYDPDPEFMRKLIACLRKLFRANKRYARTLVLAYQGYSVKDICKKLDASRQTHYSNLHRARSLLKECLEMSSE